MMKKTRSNGRVRLILAQNLLIFLRSQRLEPLAPGGYIEAPG